MEEDWRVASYSKEERTHFKGKKFLKIENVSNFWKNAYTTKNNFYEILLQEAKEFVDEFSQKPHDGLKKWLKENPDWEKDDRCREFWHDHCRLCWKKINTDLQEEWYTSNKHYEFCVCEECFNDFKERFKWEAEKIEDVPEDW